MKKYRKLLTCLFALTLAFSAVGCGSSKEQEATAEAAETGTAASETIASGADMNTELDTEDAASSETSPSLADGLIITVTKMEVEIDQNRMYVNVENTTENDIYVEWTNLIMNGKDVSNPNAWFEDWSPSEWTPCVKANEIYQEVFTIEHPSYPGHTIFNMADFEATVSSSDKSSSEPFTAFFLLSDVETVKISETGEITAYDWAASTASPQKTVIHFEEQELYNANGIVVTVPEQTISPSDMPIFHLEHQYDYGIYYTFMKLSINGELISERSGRGTADGYVTPGEYSDESIPVDFWDTISSDTDSGEITIVLDLWDDIQESIDMPEIIISFTVTEE